MSETAFSNAGQTAIGIPAASTVSTNQSETPGAVTQFLDSLGSDETLQTFQDQWDESEQAMQTSTDWGVSAAITPTGNPVNPNDKVIVDF